MIARGWSVCVAVAMLVLLGVYLVMNGRESSVAAAGLTSLLAAPQSAEQGSVSQAEADAAVRADPLNQRLVNVAIVTTARTASRPLAGDWFVTLGKLGWRDTVSRQNLMLKHAQRYDVTAVLDDVDGLLRRHQLIEQVSPALIALEGDTAWQNKVIERLRQRPAWRFGYLQRGSLIDDPAQLAARAHTLRALQLSGDDVAAGEISPTLPKLLGAGLGQDAYAIWRAREPSIARPVADPDFARLAIEQEPSAVPFHWQLNAAPDYSVDAALRPSPHLSISWNGMGAPVFAVQTLAARAGRYGIVLSTAEPDPNLAKLVGVRVACGVDVVDFGPPRRLSGTRTVYIADRAVPCAFPRLELFGRRGDQPAGDLNTAISRVSIARLT